MAYKRRITKAVSKKKVRNAILTEYNGIKFKSRLELYCYKYSNSLGYTFLYEEFKTTIFHGGQCRCNIFIPNKENLIGESNGKIRDITYSPDFYKCINNKNGEEVLVIIETKGFATDAFVLKRKMFLMLMNEKYGERLYYFEPHTQVQIRQCFEIIKDL